jgi:hypothetical protein
LWFKFISIEYNFKKHSIIFIEDYCIIDIGEAIEF